MTNTPPALTPLRNLRAIFRLHVMRVRVFHRDVRETMMLDLCLAERGERGRCIKRPGLRAECG